MVEAGNAKGRTVAAVPLPGAERRAMGHVSLDQSDSDHAPTATARRHAALVAANGGGDPDSPRTRSDEVLRGTGKSGKVSHAHYYTS
jgi:hypothetical protein